LFLPCAAGVEPLLQAEVQRITGIEPNAGRSGVRLQGTWRDVMALNLHSRLAQRVLVQLAHQPYQTEQDLYAFVHAVPWEQWFAVRQTFKVEVTARQCPLKSLNFVTLRIKDAIADRFRERQGERPSIDTRWPKVRVFAHLDPQTATVYLDTSGESLFKRGWREDKGDAPLKETLAAAMIAATGWDPHGSQPLYDPCCGSGTIAIEAAQMAMNVAPGLQRRFGFEHLLPHDARMWQALRSEAQAVIQSRVEVKVFASDVSHRMVDFAQRNAQRAGVTAAVQIRAGDALQRMPPCNEPGLLLLNPPYGERIQAAGVAGRSYRDQAVVESSGDEAASTQFFEKLAAHWKSHFGGWTAWMLSPDAKLPGQMRLRETRRVPMWNGPIECRLWRFDISARQIRSTPEAQA
jgi:putative N6-adenine-specific DNA methylase